MEELLAIGKFLQALPKEYSPYALFIIFCWWLFQFWMPKQAKVVEEQIKNLKGINKGLKNTNNNLIKVSEGMDKVLGLFSHIGDEVKDLSKQVKELPSKDFISNETSLLKKKLDEMTEVVIDLKKFLEEK